MIWARSCGRRDGRGTNVGGAQQHVLQAPQNEHGSAVVNVSVWSWRWWAGKGREGVVGHGVRQHMLRSALWPASRWVHAGACRKRAAVTRARRR
eukprot:355531-Chlamydomonas_euryale.AAC.5